MNLLWGALILVAADALAIGAMLVVRRRAPQGSYFADGDRASGVFGVLATGFAIFAGFVIFLAFTSYDQSRSGAEAEALAVVQQFETAQFFPVAVRTRLTGELVCYGRSVVYQEWPRMENGHSGNTISPWGAALFRTLKLANPTTAAEQAAFGKWLDRPLIARRPDAIVSTARRASFRLRFGSCSSSRPASSSFTCCSLRTAAKLCFPSQC
jgi:hypothetical protein